MTLYPCNPLKSQGDAIPLTQNLALNIPVNATEAGQSRL
jgi:hypothetical protein